MSAILRSCARMWRLFQSGQILRRLRDRLSPAGRAARRQKAREDAAFDALGYDTGGVQHLHRLTTIGDNGPSGSHHVAARPADFAAAMKLVDLDPSDLTFVDFGSGKGRALLMAAEMPFRRLIGIEFAREMHAVAEANFARRARSRIPDPRVELYNIDATTFVYPEEPLLLFLFNPFGPPVLTRVAEQALAAWRAQPRDIRVLYMNPVFADAWLQAGWRLLESRDGANLYRPPAA